MGKHGNKDKEQTTLPADTALKVEPAPDPAPKPVQAATTGNPWDGWTFSALRYALRTLGKCHGPACIAHAGGENGQPVTTGTISALCQRQKSDDKVAPIEVAEAWLASRGGCTCGQHAHNGNGGTHASRTRQSQQVPLAVPPDPSSLLKQTLDSLTIAGEVVKRAVASVATANQGLTLARSMAATRATAAAQWVPFARALGREAELTAAIETLGVALDPTTEPAPSSVSPQ